MQHLMPQIVFNRELISYKLLRVNSGETRAQYKPSPSKKSPVLLLQNLVISLGSNLSQSTYICGQKHVTHIYKHMLPIRPNHPQPTTQKAESKWSPTGTWSLTRLKTTENYTLMIFEKWKTGVPGDKLLGARERTNNELNPHVARRRHQNPDHIGGGECSHRRVFPCSPPLLLQQTNGTHFKLARSSFSSASEDLLLEAAVSSPSSISPSSSGLAVAFVSVWSLACSPSSCFSASDDGFGDSFASFSSSDS